MSNKYECAVKLLNVPGTGWFGIVVADTPADAAKVAGGKHFASKTCYAPGDRISHVEVRIGGDKLGDFPG